MDPNPYKAPEAANSATPEREGGESMQRAFWGVPIGGVGAAATWVVLQALMWDQGDSFDAKMRLNLAVWVIVGPSLGAFVGFVLPRLVGDGQIRAPHPSWKTIPKDTNRAPPSVQSMSARR